MIAGMTDQFDFKKLKKLKYNTSRSYKMIDVA